MEKGGMGISICAGLRPVAGGRVIAKFVFPTGQSLSSSTVEPCVRLLQQSCRGESTKELQIGWSDECTATHQGFESAISE